MKMLFALLFLAAFVIGCGDTTEKKTTTTTTTKTTEKDTKKAP